MRVKCIKSEGNLIEKDDEVVVLGLKFSLISSNHTLILPLGGAFFMEYSIADFEIVDNKASRYWEVGHPGNDYYKPKEILCIQPRSFFEQFYQQNLSDEDKTTIKNYLNIWKRMELEFPIKSISQKAVSLKKGTWVSTPGFEYSWESNPLDGMTECPETGELYHNPHYIYPGSFEFEAKNLGKFLKNITNE